MKKLIFLSFLVCLAVLQSHGQNRKNGPFKKGDVWVGTYECAGEKYEMKLNILEAQKGIIRSSFVFRNNTGSYEVIGQIKNNEFTFNSVLWEKNPTNYTTLGMHGFYLEGPDRLVGSTISKLTFSEGDECTGFYLTRQK